MNFVQNFKPEIKTFLLVALVAVIISVGGILLLHGMMPTPKTFRFVDKYQNNKFDSERIDKVVSFQDSDGAGKNIILYDTYDLDYERNFYITDEDLTRNSAIKLLEAIGNDEGKSPFISPGSLKRKYIVVQLFAGDYKDLFIADEEGNIITKGVTLGDSELGAYLLEFMDWESATTFRAKATPYPEGLPSYFITVDAVTGKVLDKTRLDVDISNWQTYRSDEFGFEVKYPENWRLESEGVYNGIVLRMSESEEEHIYIGNISIKTGQDMLDVVIANTAMWDRSTIGNYNDVECGTGGPCPPPPAENKISIRNFDGNSFYYVFNLLLEGKYGMSYFIKNPGNNTAVVFLVRGFTRSKNWTDEDYNVDEEPDHILLKQILSTFRFSL